MKTEIKKGDEIKAYFPGESMWVEVLEVISQTHIIGKLLNTPVATQVKNADAQGKGNEVPEYVRFASMNVRHNVENWGDLVELKFIDAAWGFYKKHALN